MRTLLILLIITTTNILPRVRSQDGKHNLPDNLEIVDPKSLGLGDADLEKFLGNVKLLPIDGQVGNNVKTEILTVGFDGDEKLNLADFDGLSTDGLPDQEKQVAQAAFQRFQDFFKNPSSSQNFDDAANNGGRPQNPAPRQNIQYQQPPRHVTYDQPQQGQRSQYNRDIFKEITESPLPARPVVSQQAPMYRLNPQEVMSLLTATEATTRQKSPQIYSLKESAFPQHLAQMMGMSTSIERPTTPNYPSQFRPQQPHPHVSQHSYNTPAPVAPNVQTHRTPPATHNPSYHHQTGVSGTPSPYFSAPQQQHRPSGDVRYTANPSIQQNQYVPIQTKPHSHTAEQPGQSVANHGTQQQKPQQSLPAPWGTYRPPPAPRQPQKQQEQQQQHFHTYYSQNYDLQPSIGFQVRPAPSPPQSGIGNTRGVSGHIDQGKPAHLTGVQAFQPAASSHSVTTNAHHPSQTASAAHNQQFQHGHSSSQPHRQNHLRNLKDTTLKEPRQPNQNHNSEQTRPNNMLAQIHIHHPNHKQPTILNIHQPQQPNHNAQTQAQTQSVGTHPHQKQHQHYTQAQQYNSHGYSTIYPQQNHHIQGSNNYFNAHQRQNSPFQQQQQPQPAATNYQRPSSALPPAQSTQKFSSSATPTSHPPGNNASPPLLIATTQTPLYHHQSNQDHRTSKDHKFHSYQQNQNNVIQSSPSYHHSQHLLPQYYQPAPTKATELQRETPQRQPAPPPHPPPPSIPYRNLRSETDARAPRTLAEASLPRRFSYDEWPIHRNYRSDDNDYFASGSNNNDSLQKHTDSSVDLLAGGSEHALAITRQFFNPDMIEAIQPAQMIAYGHLASSEKPEK